MNTQREEVAAITARRHAFVDGAVWAISLRGVDPPTAPKMEAMKRYPMPTVEVPRVVNDPTLKDYEWSVSNGIVRWRDRNGSGDWSIAPEAVVTVDRVKLWADLIANPTERRQVDE